MPSSTLNTKSMFLFLFCLNLETHLRALISQIRQCQSFCIIFQTTFHFQTDQPYVYNIRIANRIFSPFQFMNQVYQPKLDFSLGPDEVPGCVLKNCARTANLYLNSFIYLSKLRKNFSLRERNLLIK